MPCEIKSLCLIKNPPLIANYLVNAVSGEAKEMKNRTTFSIHVLPPGHDRNMLAEE